MSEVNWLNDWLGFDGEYVYIKETPCENAVCHIVNRQTAITALESVSLIQIMKSQIERYEKEANPDTTIRDIIQKLIESANASKDPMNLGLYAAIGMLHSSIPERRPR